MIVTDGNKPGLPRPTVTPNPAAWSSVVHGQAMNSRCSAVPTSPGHTQAPQTHFLLPATKKKHACPLSPVWGKGGQRLGLVCGTGKLTGRSSSFCSLLNTCVGHLPRARLHVCAWSPEGLVLQPRERQTQTRHYRCNVHAYNTPEHKGV